MNEQEKYDWMVYVSCMTYNHASYIIDAMNGFTMQETNFPFVCAVVDDASTDGEQEVIKNYLNEHFDLEDNNVVQHEETDDYVLTFARHKTNKNCYFAVLYLKYNHYSIKKSKAPYIAQWREKAKYIALCEGDDYWIDPQKLQKQVKELEKNPSYVLSFTNYSTLFMDGRIDNAKITGLPENDDYSLSQIARGNKVATLTVLYRVEAYKRTPVLSRHNKWKMGDLPTWIELSQEGLFKYIPEKTAVYRRLDNSASHCTDIKKRLEFIRSTFEIKKYYSNYYQKGIPSNYFEKRLYEALLNEASLRRDVELSKLLLKEAKSRKICTSDMLKTYVMTLYCNNPLLAFYLYLRNKFK